MLSVQIIYMLMEKEYEGEDLLLTLDIPAEETIIIGDTLLDSGVANT